MTEKPPAPTEWGLPEDCYLGLITEFLTPPAPEKRTVERHGAVDDRILNFGSSFIGVGQAFQFGDASRRVAVQKEWRRMPDAAGQMRDVLIEKIPYRLAAPFLAALPLPAQANANKANPVRRVATKNLKLPARVAAAPSVGKKEFQVATAPVRRDGFIVDFTILSSSSLSNFVFRADETYFCSNTVTLAGTTVWEGNSVIKFSTNATAKIIVGTNEWKSAPFQPVVFTAMDDDSVGAVLPSSMGVPTNFYGGGVQLTVTGSTAQNARFSFLRTGLELENEGSEYHGRDLQFVRCQVGVMMNSADIGVTFHLHNALFYAVDKVLDAQGVESVFRASHVTANECNVFNSAKDSSIYLTNSLLRAVTNLNDNSYHVFATNQTEHVSITNEIFQTVGAGSHYLPTNSPYLAAGTTNIDAALLASLKYKTVFGPTVWTNDFTMNTTLAPKVARDNGPAPALGYHYDPLDYVVGTVAIDGATLTLTNGVALGFYSHESGGIHLPNGGVLRSEGSPTNLNRLAWYNTVQEQATDAWSDRLSGGFFRDDGGFDVRCRFTGFSIMAADFSVLPYAIDGYHGTFRFRDCQFHGGGPMYLASPSLALAVSFTNCLLERVNIQGWWNPTNLTVQARHNLFLGGSLSLSALSEGTYQYTFQDNLFDRTAITVGEGMIISNSHNAYITNETEFADGTNDVILPHSPAYETGILGRFYYPTNLALIDAGSGSATNAGLYHFTTTTNEVKETNSVVDIGFHYVACDTNDAPMNTGGHSGRPDWMEDKNGNGECEYPAESCWNTQPPAAPGLLTGGGGTNGPVGLAAFSYTNGLWLSISNQTVTNITLAVHGTIEGEFYEILSKTNLNETNWLVIELGLIGQSNLTLADPILFSGRSNLFFQARHSSMDTDGDGLADWYELQIGLDPALADTGNTGTSDGYKDVDGDDWVNIQEFQNDTHPGTFNTPPAPQGLRVSLSTNGTIAILNWNGSSNAIGYTVERSYVDTNYWWAVDTTEITNNVNFTTNAPSPHTNAFWASFGTFYRIQAHYEEGDSTFSEEVPAVSDANAASYVWLRGSGGKKYLAVSGMPENISTLRVTRETWPHSSSFNPNPSAVSTFDVSMSSFTNGIYQIPDAQNPDATDAIFYVQTVETNGNLGSYHWLGYGQLPFFDGREHLKQNLNFHLRFGYGDLPLTLYLTRQIGSGSWVSETHSLYATNYAFATFNYKENFNSGINAFRWEYDPFVDNYRFRNFAFMTNDVTTNGYLATGASFLSYNFSGMLNAFSLTYPFKYMFTNATAVAATLDSTNLPWLAIPNRWYAGISSTNMMTGVKNTYGLLYESARHVYGTTNGLVVDTIYPGSSGSFGGSPIYVATVQPQLSHADYYFCQPGEEYYWGEDLYGFIGNWRPGDAKFSPDDPQPLIVFSANASSFISGYEKLAIDNGDTNKFAYLGQYFDKAFKADTNGVATTNETGILSEYGEFFPTEPGRTILRTKPNHGETNYGECLVHVIKMELDVNHDGTIDRTFAGPDNTSHDKPFTFWINNDNDGSIGAEAELNASPFPDSRDEEIKTKRDLEDFARLWISGMPPLPASQGYDVTLRWYDGYGPTIRLFESIEADGGMAYLTNNTTAASIVTTDYRLALGTVSPTNTFHFPDDYFTNGSRKHFLFEGVSPGKWNLVLRITKDETNIVTETSVWIELKDIKDMYEQGMADNVTTNSLPPSSSISRYQAIKTLSANSAETRQIILFVHGINNTEWEYQNTSETMFKRLYWSGYQGRFASFRWPSPLLPECEISPAVLRGSPFNYNKGEYIAWKSANALASYLTSLNQRFPDYSINVYGHSMGNIVVGEALKNGAPFDNYILSQAAVPAHAYDINTNNVPFLQKFLTAEQSESTPLEADDGGYHGYFTNITGNLINFYNTNDYALAKGTCAGLQANWEENHRTQKPESLGLQSYGFDGTNCLRFIFDPGPDPNQTNVVTDAYEKKACVARSRSQAVGALGSVNGVINTTDSVDLFTQFGFGDSRSDHSAQFTRNIQVSRPYYRQVLSSFNIQPAP